MDRLEARRRDVSGHEKEGVAGQDPNVRQGSLGHSLGGLPGVLLGQFDPEKVVVGLACRRVDQEQPLAGTDFQLDRVVIAEDLGPGDWGE